MRYHHVVLLVRHLFEGSAMACGEKRMWIVQAGCGVRSLGGLLCTVACWWLVEQQYLAQLRIAYVIYDLPCLMCDIHWGIDAVLLIDDATGIILQGSTMLIDGIAAKNVQVLTHQCTYCRCFVISAYVLMVSWCPFWIQRNFEPFHV
jgi:hypothetical protein